MSGRGAITWGRIVETCQTRGISIEYGKGSERKLKGRSPDGRSRVQVIGHEWCRSKNTVVPIPIVAAFKRNFGVTDDELRGPPHVAPTVLRPARRIDLESDAP